MMGESKERGEKVEKTTLDSQLQSTRPAIIPKTSPVTCAYLG